MQRKVKITEDFDLLILQTKRALFKKMLAIEGIYVEYRL